ncbi:MULTISPECIES: hypothetical protein [Pseudoalteromonas]|uniref:Uncharacterized protein n=1 Tax=Pseudoalteromonas amylolytica TaxID=1859457 RepID=A0A1S1N0G1_9GAMM|nr:MULTISPECIES: hypothetical protein [Pseudoalteromonas]OHU88076.1 hypothetical protein BFC16_11840 [Pseudoalteromonas sp. JW3]OHU91516.1 hypothetical protein BET10_11960 [Pseudoalteromonas amylolytica]
MTYNLKGCALALGLVCSAVLPLQSNAASVPLTANELNEFRSDLNDYFEDSIRAVAQLNNSQQIVNQFEQAQNMVSNMSQQQLIETYQAMEANPNFWELPEHLYQVANFQKSVGEYKSSPKFLQYNIMTSDVSTSQEKTYASYNEEQCDFVEDLLEEFPFQAFLLPDEVAIAILSIAADGVANALSPSVVTVAAGNGGGVPNPLKIGAVAAAQVLKLHWQSIKWYRQAIAECKGKIHRDYLYEVVGLQQADFTPKKEIQLSTDFVDRRLRGRVHDYYFMLHAKLDGEPVDVEFVSAKVTDESLPIEFKELAEKRTVSMRKLGPGMYELKLTYDNPGFFHPRKMQLVVKHSRPSAKADETVTHKGVSFTNVMN